MALGDHLVRELGLEQSVDTLGRWMAHHLAELIELARTSRGVERETAQAKAVDVILKIWAHRGDLPGGAYPLKRFTDVVDTIRCLRASSDPFRHYHQKESQRLLSEAFQGLAAVVAHGLVLFHRESSRIAMADEARACLDQDEQEVLEALDAWSKFFAVGDQEAVAVVAADEGAGSAAACSGPSAGLGSAGEAGKQLFAKEIDHVVETLVELKRAIAVGLTDEPSDQQVRKRAERVWLRFAEAPLEGESE